MSGTEALGIVASASQLAAYSIKIVIHLNELYTQMWNTPIRTKEHLDQIRDLIETTALIAQQKSLRSPVIHAQLQSTILQAQSLYHTLKNLGSKYTEKSIWRYWALLKGVDDREILGSLNKLEREKSTLKLCISVAHTDLLQGIKGSIESISHGRMPEQTTHSTVTEGASHNSGPPHQALIVVANPQKHKGDETPGKSGGASTSGGVPSNFRFTEEPSRSGHTYDNVRALSSATQVCGDVNDSGSASSSTRSHQYTSVSADGRSRQVIGNINSSASFREFFADRE